MHGGDVCVGCSGYGGGFHATVCRWCYLTVVAAAQDSGIELFIRGIELSIVRGERTRCLRRPVSHRRTNAVAR